MRFSSVRLAIGAGIAAIAAASTVALAVPAGATISPTTTYTSTGVAGYYAAPNANRLGNGDHVTGVRANFNLTAASENNTIDNGVELCRAQSLINTTTAAAVLYAQWNSNTNLFDIIAAHSTTTNCLAAQGGTNNSTTIDTIAPGHNVQLEITVSNHHIITFTDSDETNLTGGNTTFGGFTFGFDRAGVGANGDNGTLTGPASNLETSFVSSGVRDGSGWALINRHNLTRLIINKVVDNNLGTSAGEALITPGPIASNSGNFPLYFGQLSGQ